LLRLLLALVVLSLGGLLVLSSLLMVSELRPLCVLLSTGLHPAVLLAVVPLLLALLSVVELTSLLASPELVESFLAVALRNLLPSTLLVSLLGLLVGLLLALVRLLMMVLSRLLVLVVLLSSLLAML